MDLLEALARDVGVDFGGADARMAQHFLDDAEVGAVLEQVRREAVPEHVRSNVFIDATTFDALFDVQPKGHAGESGAATGEENSAGGAGFDELWARGAEVTFERGDGGFADRDDAFLVPLANDVDEA